MDEEKTKPFIKKGKNKGWDNLKPIKKGEVRNPKGRPKKENTYSDTLVQLLAGQEINVTWTVNGKNKSLQVTSDNNLYYGIASAQIMEALNGNIAAQKEIIDRIQGKAPQSINVNSEEIDMKDALRELARQRKIANTSTTAIKPDPDTA